MKREMKESMCRIGKIVGIAIVVYACIRWLLPSVIPFFIAFLLAKWLSPLVRKLNKRIKIKRSIIATAVVGIFFVLLVGIMAFFFRSLFGQVQRVISNMGDCQKQMGSIWNQCCRQVENFTGIQANEVKTGMAACIPKFQSQIEEKFLPSLLNGTVIYARNLLILCGVCFVIVISTILILRDYEKIKEGLNSNPIGKGILQVGRRTYRAGGAYIKAQFIIMIFVTIICVIGLYLSGNQYALLVGCGIGVCDAMPFLGTGTIFVPWALIEIVQGKYTLAAIYATIYTLCSFLREILEPKIIGDKLGMPPLVVIISIYVGLNVYGIWGFLLGPFSYVLIREIYDCNFDGKLL